MLLLDPKGTEGEKRGGGWRRGKKGMRRDRDRGVEGEGKYDVKGQENGR